MSNHLFYDWERRKTFSGKFRKIEGYVQPKCVSEWTNTSNNMKIGQNVQNWNKIKVKNPQTFSDEESGEIWKSLSGGVILPPLGKNRVKEKCIEIFDKLFMTFKLTMENLIA